MTEGHSNLEREWEDKDLQVLRQVVQGSPQLLAHFSVEDRAMLDVNHDGKVDEADIAALCDKLMNVAAVHDLGVSEKLTHLRDKLR